jgi:Cu+-exporting ATPase
MIVAEDEAAGQIREDGETYLFCSTYCLHKFEADPEQYLHEHPSEVSAHKESPAQSQQDRATYTCPMHPEVRQQGPGSCPKCGMALEPLDVAMPEERVEYTCPMHPEVVSETPGNCPKCGMALEPRTMTAAEQEEENPELADMRKRFWVSAVLTIPLLTLTMGHMIPGVSLTWLTSAQGFNWVQLAMATPVVLWGGWPFFIRAWQSLVHRSLNMFTLIGLGVGVAYVYSVVAALYPETGPEQQSRACWGWLRRLPGAFEKTARRKMPF